MDIVEEFVVTLGLDPSKYKKESAELRETWKRDKEEARRQATEIETANRRAAESFSRLKNEAIGFILTIAGARSIGGLISDMVHGAAETGRFAQSMDLATERVSVWEMAVQSMGGTAQDARAALAALNAEYTSYMLTGRAAHDADLNAMGISARDLQSPEELALALAERRNNMTRREFTARLQRMGLPDSFIRTLAEGRRGVEQLLDQMQRVGPVTERDARAAMELERQWSILTNRLRSELRPALTWLVDHALPWIEEHGPAVARVLGVGIAGAIGLMTAALIRAGGPLGGVIAGLTAIIGLMSQIRDLDQVGGAYHDLYLRMSEAARRENLRQFDEANPIERDAAGNPIINDRNREIMAQRQVLLERIAETTDLRLQMSRRVHGPDAPSASGGGAPGYTGHWQHFTGDHQAPGGDLARVRATESGSNYNRVVYDAIRGVNLTGMTMGEVYAWQNQVLRPRTRGRRGRLPDGRYDPGSTGVGAYQFEAGTLAENAALEFGPGWRSVPFSPANQDRVAQRLHSRAGLTPWAIGGTGGRTSLRGGAATAMRSGRGGGGSSVSVGSVVVYVPPGTPRQQAERVADEIPRAVQRRGVVSQANSGLK